MMKLGLSTDYTKYQKFVVPTIVLDILDWKGLSLSLSWLGFTISVELYKEIK